MIIFLSCQGGTQVKNVYASLANGTLVVFAPKSSSGRRYSHSDVTLITKGEDELVTRESTKWSNIQVLSYISFGSWMLDFYG